MMKKIVRKMTAAILTAGLTLASLSLTASAATVSDFTDVKPGSWYYNAVQYAVDNGLFSGTSGTTFSPEQGMTRGMFVTVLGRKNGVDASEYSGTFPQHCERHQRGQLFAQWFNHP